MVKFVNEIKNNFQKKQVKRKMNAIRKWWRANVRFGDDFVEFGAKEESCDAKHAPTASTFAADEAEVDKRWLENFHKKQTAAIEFCVAQEIAQFKTDFAASVNHGVDCSCKFFVDKNRKETLARLKALGFIVGKRKIEHQVIFNSDGARCKVLEHPYVNISLPHSSNFAQDKEWRQWLRKMKKTHQDARQKLVLRQFEVIKSKFDEAALRGESTICVSAECCFAETCTMLRNRLGCVFAKQTSGGSSVVVYIIKV